MTDPVRWGVLGAGWLVQHATAAAIHNATGATLYATGARDLGRARATEPKIAFDTYQQVIENEQVEAVYICLANDAHLEWIEAAVRAGKHVLCEKPMVLTSEQAASAFALAEQHGVYLVEATWSRWHPRMRRIVELASAGALGQLISYRATFTFDGVSDANYRLFPEHGGGALYDVGIYPLHGLVACLPGVEDFDVVDASYAIGGHGVDLSTHGTLTWGGETRGDFSASFIEPANQELTVTGTQGQVRVTDGEAFSSWRTASQLLVDDHVEEFGPVDAYQLMFEEVSDRIRGGEGWLLPPRDSLRVARLVDSLLPHR